MEILEATQWAEMEVTKAEVKEKLRNKMEELAMLENKRPMDGHTIFVLDTNTYMEQNLLAFQVAAQRLCQLKTQMAASLIIPKEVLSELDRHKANKANPEKAFRAREAVRYIGAMQDEEKRIMQGNGCKFTANTIIRGQQDREVYRDEAFHKYPERLRGDDSIMNCCMYMESQGGKVLLCSNDAILRQRAEANGMHAFALDKLHSEIRQLELR